MSILSELSSFSSPCYMMFYPRTPLYCKVVKYFIDVVTVQAIFKDERATFISSLLRALVRTVYRGFGRLSLSCNSLYFKVVLSNVDAFFSKLLQNYGGGCSFAIILKLLILLSSHFAMKALLYIINQNCNSDDEPSGKIAKFCWKIDTLNQFSESVHQWRCTFAAILERP